MNIIILSKNYEDYTSGYYHQDIINAFQHNANCFLYGEGYPDYKKNDTINDVIVKSNFKKSDIDLIVASTSWELQNPNIPASDPHPSIDLSSINTIPKVFFLNKEYKKLDAKLEYAVKNQFNLVCTVHPDWEKWQARTGIPFMWLPMGIDIERFKPLNIHRKWDFTFTGNLHRSHIDMRFAIKKELFKEKFLEEKSNRSYCTVYKSLIKKEFNKYKIYWAEWGAKPNIFYQSLLPTGSAYNKLLNQSKVFLNTPSAVGIINTRFFELMATKTLILCPESNYYQGLLKDNDNCIMFKGDLSNFKEKLMFAIDNEDERRRIIEEAYKNSQLHSYNTRIKALLIKLNLA